MPATYYSPQCFPHHRLYSTLQVADICHAPSEQAALAAALAAHAEVARRAKWVVELDRCHAAMEAGYCTALVQVLGAEDMAKNDLLIGVPGPPGTDAAAAAPAAMAEAGEGGREQTGGGGLASAAAAGPAGGPQRAAAAAGEAAAAVDDKDADRWAPCRAALQEVLTMSRPGL